MNCGAPNPGVRIRLDLGDFVKDETRYRWMLLPSTGLSTVSDFIDHIREEYSLDCDDVVTLYLEEPFCLASRESIEILRNGDLIKVKVSKPTRARKRQRVEDDGEDDGEDDVQGGVNDEVKGKRRKKKSETGIPQKQSNVSPSKSPSGNVEASKVTRDNAPADASAQDTKPDCNNQSLGCNRTCPNDEAVKKAGKKQQPKKKANNKNAQQEIASDLNPPAKVGKTPNPTLLEYNRTFPNDEAVTGVSEKAGKKQQPKKKAKNKNVQQEIRSDLNPPAKVGKTPNPISLECNRTCPNDKAVKKAAKKRPRRKKAKNRNALQEIGSDWNPPAKVSKTPNPTSPECNRTFPNDEAFKEAAEKAAQNAGKKQQPQRKAENRNAQQEIGSDWNPPAEVCKTPKLTWPDRMFSSPPQDVQKKMSTLYAKSSDDISCEDVLLPSHSHKEGFDKLLGLAQRRSPVRADRRKKTFGEDAAGNCFSLSTISEMPRKDDKIAFKVLELQDGAPAVSNFKVGTVLLTHNGYLKIKLTDADGQPKQFAGQRGAQEDDGSADTPSNVTEYRWCDLIEPKILKAEI